MSLVTAILLFLARSPPWLVLPVSTSCTQSLARKWKIPSSVSDRQTPCKGHLGLSMGPPVGKQVEVDSQWEGITKETAVSEWSQVAHRLC